MPKFLLAASVAILIFAGVLSVQTKSQIEKIVSELKTTKGSLADSKRDLNKAIDQLRTTQEQLAAEKTNSDNAIAEGKKARNDADAAKAALEDSNSKLAAATTQIDDLNRKLAEAKPSDITNGATVAEIEAKLKEAETKIGELETVNKTLTQKNADSETKLAGLQKAETQRQGKLMAKGLTGQVLAVNRAYNFLVISLGDKQGVVMNGEMIIKRGAIQVARVKITSVEPTTSIADIVPGSLGRGSSVQAGDEVIYPGNGI